MRAFQKYRAMWIICIAIGWWGVWFPELVVWTDAVCVTEDVCQEDSVQMQGKVVECDSVHEICEGLMYADKEQIQIKSRLFMLIEQYLWDK